MNLSGSRPWVIGGALGALVLIALSWVLVIGPTRSDTSTLHEDTAAVQQQNQVLAARADALRAKTADRDQIQAQARAALEALPGGPALPDLNQELTQHADAHNVILDNISVASAASSATGSSASGLMSVPVTIQTTGPLANQLAFLRDLQQGPRAALVTSTSLTTADGARAGTVSLTVQFTVFSAALSASDLADLPPALAETAGSTR